MIRQIGMSATKNYLRMKFSLPLRTNSIKPFRTNWRIKERTIIPYPTKNGVTFCPPQRLKIKGK